MTANKMPEMPPAFSFHNNLAANPLYTADQMRAMYLAGIEAARTCVPAEIYERGAAEKHWNACRATTLTTLTALEQEAKK